MITLRGAEVSAKLKEEVQEELKTLKRIPKLAIIRVGNRPDDISYENGAIKKLQTFGLLSERFLFPEEISDEEFKAEFEKINRNPEVDGILMMRPLPKQIKESDIEKMIAPAKDLDGISPVNVAKVFSGDKSGFAPCTAEAVMELLRVNGFDLTGKRAVVVGRSMVVGKPLAMLLLKENATVTICHTKTRDLADRCREADILLAAAGKAGLITADFVGDGAVVIDVGINVDEEGHLCGDVDFAGIQEKAAYATPVPGGVGGVTTAVLAKHLV
ncbi:MAG: bifunctional 5,10-methylenetetrahydrofolate dehydrogenase/5,10-methenyltetrahydrofolate cyclohydrolase, partial [Clostridium sp.]|nr:bifunctional 5,10-methylenetetrahydrofolate dehydrogenase/5,10-methenyltetrahydrofolate cyclohydrolase [Clostridium sp.]